MNQWPLSYTDKNLIPLKTHRLLLPSVDPGLEDYREVLVMSCCSLFVLIRFGMRVLLNFSFLWGLSFLDIHFPLYCGLVLRNDEYEEKGGWAGRYSVTPVVPSDLFRLPFCLLPSIDFPVFYSFWWWPFSLIWDLKNFFTDSSSLIYLMSPFLNFHTH